MNCPKAKAYKRNDYFRALQVNIKSKYMKIKYKNQILLLLFMLILSEYTTIFAQNNEALMYKYWTYKQRFLGDWLNRDENPGFVNEGVGNGRSTPVVIRDKFKRTDFWKWDNYAPGNNSNCYIEGVSYHKPDTILIKNRSSFSFGAGMQYRFIYGYNKPIHIDTTIDREINLPSDTIYLGFKYYNNFSYHTNALYFFRINKRFRLGTGLEFINRKTVLRIPIDTALKYQNSDIIEHNINYLSFEIPIQLEFLLSKKTSLNAGVTFSKIHIIHHTTFNSSGKKTIVKNVPIPSTYNYFYPSLKFVYKIFNFQQKYPLCIYIEGNYIENRTIDLKTGILLQIF